MKKLVCIFLLVFILVFAATADELVEIDGDFSDWDNIPYIASFSWSFNPVYFTRELNGNIANYNIDSAYFWKKDGSHIRGIKAYIDNEALYLYIENHSNYSENLSMYMYIYPRRKDNVENDFTIEIIPATEFEISENQDKGGVVLWENGVSRPVNIGLLRNSFYNMEFSIPIEELPKSLIGSFGTLSFDLTTCVSEPDTGIFEEFFFTAIYVKDIPRVDDL